MREAKSKGMIIRPPDILLSDMTWTVSTPYENVGMIVAGFTQIKGNGDTTARRTWTGGMRGEARFGLDDFFPGVG